VDADGDLDLAFGTTKAVKVFLDSSTSDPWVYNHPGIDIAWGDSDDDGDLDLLICDNDARSVVLLSNQGGDEVDMAAVWSSTTGAISAASAQSADSENKATEIPAVLAPNPTSTPDDLLDFMRTPTAPTIYYFPLIASNFAPDPRSIAWGDFNGDRYLDFAVGNAGQPVHVYCNNRDNTFTLIWQSLYGADTRSVAWADYDSDGDLDLATGSYGGRNYVYQNTTCDDDDEDSPSCPFLDPDLSTTCEDWRGKLNTRPVWSSKEFSQTTSLAWGDWDNDGDLDLAVGNDGERDQVYANLSTPGAPRLDWAWTSQEISQTTSVAWGDKDRDGV